MKSEEDSILISKADLPECKVVELDGKRHIDCGSDWGTWDVQHVARIRETALEYVAAWLTAEEWNSKLATLERRLNTRRDELAAELFNTRFYADLRAGANLAIDRIIELEEAR